MLSFDGVAVAGKSGDVYGLTLEARVHGEGADGGAIQHRLAVVHLRGSAAAMAALRTALDRLELLATKTDGPAN